MTLLKSILSFFTKKRSIKKQSLPSPASYFDSTYYLATYSDVAAAGVDPWHHFYHHGYAEGRWPTELQAVNLESQLWSESTKKQTEQLLLDLTQTGHPEEQSVAAWLLGRYYAAHGQWGLALKLMPFFTQAKSPLPGHLAPCLLWLEVLRQQDLKQGQQYLLDLKERYPQSIDVALVTMNFSELPKEKNSWWQPLNSHYHALGLASIDLTCKQGVALFDCLTPYAELPLKASGNNSALVSVIVPTYNAEKTINTALRSLTQQSWTQLEILVVDDASTDQTLTLVEKCAEQDARIRIIKQAANQGAYITRNLGLSQSQGEFITVHDSDDWSHPQKIEQQLQPLLMQQDVKATLSHWVRASDDLFFGGWRSPEDWNGLVHRNVSSLLMRRQVFIELGYWDNVVCSADTEYYYRIIAAYGIASLQEVHGGLPLAFGRVREGSLTQRSETHIFSIFSGLRYDYKEAYQQWHASCTSKNQLYLPQYPETRPFVVDAKMLPLSQRISGNRGEH